MLLWKYSQAENFARETAPTDLSEKDREVFHQQIPPKILGDF